MRYDDYKLSSPTDKDICRHCDEDEIRRLAYQKFEASLIGLSEDEEPEKDEQEFIEEEMSEYSLCRSCYESDNAD